jgi:hypothetical protein
VYAGHFDFTHPLVWTVDGLLSADECRAVLGDPSQHEWLSATVNRAEGRAVDRRLRDNTVAVLRDQDLADRLFERVRPHVPETLSGMRVHGVHMPVRIYRYDVGQRFGVHQDQSYFADERTRSLLTFMVYLNEGFSGGETEFVDLHRTIAPKAGMALLFQHMLNHAGCEVTAGAKYVLRSDVLYRET